MNAAGYPVSQWQVQDKEAAQETDRQTDRDREMKGTLKITGRSPV